MTDESNCALFIDFENLAIGVRQSGYTKFDIELLLKRLTGRGRLLFRRAYCDWGSYESYKTGFHEAGIELFEIPQRSSGKNSADIRMVVDALDLCTTRKHIDTFVIASGDSDFSPLVVKLREYNKTVVGIGVKNSTSDLLVDVCDEFIFYEDLIREVRPSSHLQSLPKKKREVFELLEQAVAALQRQGKEILWSSMVKQTMQRLKPTFEMSYFGYRTFSALLKDAQKNNILIMEKDDKSGSYIILDLGAEEN